MTAKLILFFFFQLTFRVQLFRRTQIDSLIDPNLTGDNNLETADISERKTVTDWLQFINM